MQLAGIAAIAVAVMIGTVGLAATVTGKPADNEPVVREAVVNAPREDVWKAFTTDEGALTFLAPASKIEARLGGPYEVYFLLDNPPGLRGGEGNQILACEPPSRLLVTWNAPPQFARLRVQKTVLEIILEPVDARRTKVRLVMSGFGRGSEWAEIRVYFEQALKVVLGRLAYRFDKGPLDWKHPVNGIEYLDSLRRHGNS